MRDEHHLMIDLETLGTQPGCVVLSIATVPFDPYGNRVDLERAYYSNIDMGSCFEASLQVDPKTFQWWFTETSEQSRAALFNPAPIDLETVARTWLGWLEMFGDPRTAYFWSHGAGFDLPIWEFALSMLEVEAPWDYRRLRDTRTLFHLADYEYHASGDHNALRDAALQAKAVQGALQVLASRGGLEL